MQVKPWFHVKIKFFKGFYIRAAAILNFFIAAHGSITR